MNGHGPDRASYDKAVAADLRPVKITDTMAFMFETRFPVRPTRWATGTPTMQLDYGRCLDWVRQSPIAVTAEARLYATPPGIRLGPLAAIAPGGARNYVVQMRAGRFHGFVVRRGDAVFGYVDRCPMRACHWRRRWTTI